MIFAIILLAFVAGYYVGKMNALKQTTEALKDFNEKINYKKPK